MINDVKLGFKMMKYAHGIKGNIVCGVLLLLLSVVFLIPSRVFSGVGIYAGFLMMVVGMFPTQMLFSMDVTGVVLSSSARKRMQTSVPVLCNFVTMGVLFTITALIRGLVAWNVPELLQVTANELVVTAILGMIVILYMALGYKKFWLSTILFIGFYIFLLIADEAVLKLSIFKSGASAVLLAWVLGLVLLAVASVLAYGLTLAVYRFPVSKMSQPVTLRKYL